MNLSEVTRIEVISDSKREFVRYGVKQVDMTLQDEGNTLKIFYAPHYVEECLCLRDFDGNIKMIHVDCEEHYNK